MGPPDERGSRDAAADRVADLAEYRLMRADLDGHAETPVESAPVRFGVRRVDHPRGVVLILGGELDLATVPLLQEHLDRAMPGGAAVVIELAGLEFIDSQGLQVLVRADRQLRAFGGQLVLLGGPRAVHRVFELTGLDRYFEWCDRPGAQTAGELDHGRGGVMRS